MKEDIYKLLKWSHFTDGFTNEDIEDLSDYFESMSYLRGDRIFSQGTAGIGMGILIRGRADIIIRANDGTEKTIAQVCQNEIVGEMSILEDLPRMANVVAAEECTAILITRPNFEELLAENSAVAAKFLLATGRTLAHRIRSAHLKKVI